MGVDGTAQMTAEVLVIDEGESLLETIRAARAGDDAAFDEIMILTERRVAQIAWRILGDTEEVKDAIQETFLRVFRHLGRYDEKQDFFAWLSRIAVNASLDLHRRRKRRRWFEPLEQDAPSKATAADDELVHRSDLTLLRKAIDMLAPRERAAILLRDVEGLPTDEVAAALGNTVATVRVQLSRARVKLRKFVESLQKGRKS
jgi:RNA polymerase sigma-70 factor (ECF subfamily)